jgi:DNA-binding MarR family transcriptional regulator
MLNKSAMTKEEAALRRCVLIIEAFRAIRRIMPLQHAYAFLLVASEEGCSVSEYARRAGVTQAVMTRILFALGTRARGREAGYGLVQQVTDLEDSRTTQTFLTAKGKALRRDMVRLIRFDHQHEVKLRPLAAENSQGGLQRDQWLSKLIATARKLDADDIHLVVRQVQTLIHHWQSKKSSLHRHHRN